ncbi:MAG: type I-E CRISPR-associated protein Cse2/CasB [Candidatus Anammoxibacter sp.]
MDEKVDKSIERLMSALDNHKARDDRGVMADLKRGFSENTADRSWPYLAKWGCNITNDRERQTFQLVSASYALTKSCNIDKYNMGDVCRTLAMGDSHNEKEKEKGLKSFDARFRRLLTCSSRDELCKHLVGVIRAAAVKDIAINFRQLFKDLWYWPGNVKLYWAEHYWKSEGEE